MYQWILRRRGHTVSNIAYFVYVDGQHVGETGMLDESDPTRAAMQFNAAIIPARDQTHWVEDKLIEAKKTLESVQQPMHGSGCDVARFLSQTLLFSTPNPLINSAASALPKAQMLQQQLKAKLSPKMQELLSEDQKSRRKFDIAQQGPIIFVLVH